MFDGLLIKQSKLIKLSMFLNLKLINFNRYRIIAFCKALEFDKTIKFCEYSSSLSFLIKMKTAIEPPVKHTLLFRHALLSISSIDIKLLAVRFLLIIKQNIVENEVFQNIIEKWN